MSEHEYPGVRAQVAQRVLCRWWRSCWRCGASTGGEAWVCAWASISAWWRHDRADDVGVSVGSGRDSGAVVPSVSGAGGGGGSRDGHGPGVVSADAGSQGWPLRGDRGRRRVRVRRVFLGTAVALPVVLVGSATLIYLHLNGNIQTSPLYSGLRDGNGTVNGGVSIDAVASGAGTETLDMYGHSPLNILAIGSDARNNARDCHLGGDCGPGAHADVEMLVHLSADRTNATVLSIPRDTMTNLPGCKDPKTDAVSSAHFGQINSSLAYGPGCTVAAVDKLTGITIDHFVMVDFAGVVTMSDAVGGVPVCLTMNVYDTYSKLKLSAGTHTLKGAGALAFLRSRHAFGDGSDLGRAFAQHQFLSSLIRTLKATGTLTDPLRLYDLADAATKALTVDPHLGSIPALLGLAKDLNKVPTKRITFLTMPNGPDPRNSARVIPAVGAKALFLAIAEDHSLTAPSASRHSSTSTTTSPNHAIGGPAPSAIRLHVANGSERTGRVSAVVNVLIAGGFTRASTTTSASTTATTTLRYGPGQRSAAQEVASALRLPASALVQGQASVMTLTIGQDWPSGSTYAGGTTGAGVLSATQAQAANALTANKSGTCTTVSAYATVVLNGSSMTPTRAYALSPNVPDSAP